MRSRKALHRHAAFDVAGEPFQPVVEGRPSVLRGQFLRRLGCAGPCHARHLQHIQLRSKVIDGGSGVPSISPPVLPVQALNLGVDAHVAPLPDGTCDCLATVTKREAQNVWLSFAQITSASSRVWVQSCMRWPSSLMNSRKRTSAAGTLLKLLSMLTVSREREAPGPWRLWACAHRGRSRPD
jgi:hypothetical protein